MPEEEEAKPSSSASRASMSRGSTSSGGKRQSLLQAHKQGWVKPSERKRMEEEARQKAAEEAERKAEEDRQAAEIARRKAEDAEKRRLEEEERERIRRYNEEAEFLRTTLPQITEQQRPFPSVLEDADWAVIVRGLWHDLEDIVVDALTALHAACKNKFRANQSVFATTKDAMTRLVALLADNGTDDVLNAVALALAALCNGAYRPCQDAWAMTGNGMVHLAELMHDEQTAQAACLAIGHLCHFHRGNQDSFSVVPNAAENLLDLVEDEDGEMARAAEFAVFWAVSDASKGTRTLWERAQGNCQSLNPVAPKLHEWEMWPEDQRHVLHGKVKTTRRVSNFSRSSRLQANLAHVNLNKAARRASARMGLPIQNQAASEANMERAFKRASMRLGLPATPEHSQSDSSLHSSPMRSPTKSSRPTSKALSIVEHRNASKMSILESSHSGGSEKAHRASVIADYRGASKMSVAPQDIRAASKRVDEGYCLFGHGEHRGLRNTGFIQPMSEGKRSSICV